MTKAHDDANRPLLDPDFLTIEDVSMLLRCAVDTVFLSEALALSRLS